MSGILQENLVPFIAAGSSFPGRCRVSNSTLHRWRLRGVRGCKLETILVGGQRFTSVEAIERFIAAQNPANDAQPTITAEQRQARSTVARAELAARGI